MYCPAGHTSFSLLPDFFASRIPGLLDELEQVAVEVEQAPSVAKAAETLRPAEAPDAVTSTAAIRWTARRMALLKTVLLAVIGLFADSLAGVRSVSDLRERLGTHQALRALREKAVAYLPSLPPPLGFGPRPRFRQRRRRVFQHDMGEEPPGLIAVLGRPRSTEEGRNQGEKE
jgi:hypothetical protein